MPQLSTVAYSFIISRILYALQFHTEQGWGMAVQIRPGRKH